MDRKTKLDLKDALRGAAETAQGKLDIHGVRDDLDDTPVFDRSRRGRRNRSLRQDMLDEIRSWEDD